MERNALVKAMKGKPVKFLAVIANVTPAEASAYVQQTQLAIPVYADNLGLMQKRYGTKISLQNIWQFRLVGPNGKVMGYDMSKDAIEKALEKTKPEWKYPPSDYDAKLGPALDAFEWGQFAQGMKLLTPLRRSPSKPVASASAKLFEALKKQGEEWKTEADQIVEAEPVRAYDLYTRIASLFAGDELAKSTAAPLKKLRANKDVMKELTARRAFAQVTTSLGRMTVQQKPAAAKLCRDIAKRYDGTPTADKADSLAKELAD